MELPIETGTVTIKKLVKYKSDKLKKTFYGIQHEGVNYFLGKSLKVGKKEDGLPNVKIGDTVRIGYYNSDKGRTNVAYALGAEWEEYVAEMEKVKE